MKLSPGIWATVSDTVYVSSLTLPAFTYTHKLDEKFLPASSSGDVLVVKKENGSLSHTFNEIVSHLQNGKTVMFINGVGAAPYIYYELGSYGEDYISTIWFRMTKNDLTEEKIGITQNNEVVSEEKDMKLDPSCIEARKFRYVTPNFSGNVDNYEHISYTKTLESGDVVTTYYIKISDDYNIPSSSWISGSLTISNGYSIPLSTTHISEDEGGYSINVGGAGGASIRTKPTWIWCGVLTPGIWIFKQEVNGEDTYQYTTSIRGPFSTSIYFPNKINEDYLPEFQKNNYIYAGINTTEYTYGDIGYQFATHNSVKIAEMVNAGMQPVLIYGRYDETDGVYVYDTFDFDCIHDNIASFKIVKGLETNYLRIDAEGNVTSEIVDISQKQFILRSSTEGSAKQFSITVDDTGTLTVTEIV